MNDRRRPRPRLASPIGAAVFLAVAAFGMSGCFTGERPTFAHQGTTGSAAVDAVYQRVSSIGSASYTAEYDVVTKFANVTTDVRAAQSSGSRRSLTVGDVRYLVDASTTKTCTVSTGDCTDSIDPARVSDVQMTPDFFGTSLAARLRHDAEIALAEPTASAEEFEDRTATCVTIPVEGASNTYCVFDDGVLARLDAADLAVTLVAYSETPDETLFADGA